MLLASSSIKDTLCDVQWIYCNKMFCYHLEDLQTVLTLTRQVGKRETFPFPPPTTAGGGQKAHKLEGEL